jgi:hypothetical protein
MIRVGVLLAVGVSCAACSATTSQRDVPTSTTAIPRVCAGPDPLDVATKFVHAVKAADPATYQQCEDPTRQVDANTIESVAAGNWLIDKAALGIGTDPAKQTVVYQIPAPLIPGDTSTQRLRPHVRRPNLPQQPTTDPDPVTPKSDGPCGNGTWRAGRRLAVDAMLATAPGHSRRIRMVLSGQCCSPLFPCAATQAFAGALLVKITLGGLVQGGCL